MISGNSIMSPHICLLSWLNLFINKILFWITTYQLIYLAREANGSYSALKGYVWLTKKRFNLNRVFFVLYMEDSFSTKYFFIWSVCHQLIYLVKSSFDGVIKLWCFNVKISKLIYVVIKLWSKLIYVVIHFPQNVSSYGVSFSYIFTICMSFLTEIASQYMY